MPNLPETNKRIRIIDGIRGVAIIGMMVHHFLFDINNFLEIPIPVLQAEWFNGILTFGAGIFVFLCGTSTALSRNNLKRGAILVGFAIGETLITWLFMPEVAIWFGILHMLGISLILMYLLRPLLQKLHSLFV